MLFGWSNYNSNFKTCSHSFPTLFSKFKMKLFFYSKAIVATSHTKAFKEPMSLINVISTLTSFIASKQEHAKCISTLTRNTAVLLGVEKHEPGFKAFLASFHSDIIDLQTIIDMSIVIEMGFTKDKDKKRKFDKSVDSTTESVDSTTDLAKIRQELEEALKQCAILKQNRLASTLNKN